MASALQSLPSNQRVVVVLRYFEDLSENGIATALGVPAGTVKSRCARGLDQLRQVLTLTTSSPSFGSDPDLRMGQWSQGRHRSAALAVDLAERVRSRPSQPSLGSLTPACTAGMMTVP